MEKTWFIFSYDEVDGEYDPEEFDTLEEAREALEEYVEDLEDSIDFEVTSKTPDKVEFEIYKNDGDWVKGWAKIEEVEV